MPNWCNNTISIQGPADQVTKIWLKANGKDDRGLLNAMKPMPQELEGTTSPTPQKGQAGYKGEQPVVDGHTNWYDWRVQNWGTKWEVDTEGLELSEDGTTISGWFESAWAPPIEALHYLVDNNPDLDVKCHYHEGGMDFAGIWDNGSDDCISPSEYTSQQWLEAPLDTMLGELEEQFGIGEQMAEYEAEEQD